MPRAIAAAVSSDSSPHLTGAGFVSRDACPALGTVPVVGCGRRRNCGTLAAERGDALEPVLHAFCRAEDAFDFPNTSRTDRRRPVLL